MNTEAHQKVTASHLKRGAYLYVRQSTLRQVMENTESTQRQYALRQRAVALGWPNESVVVIEGCRCPVRLVAAHGGPPAHRGICRREEMVPHPRVQGRGYAVPTSFFVNGVLRRRFWKILEGALFLFKAHGYAGDNVPVEAACRLVEEALGHAARLEMEADEHELRRVLRPEAEAALWWAIQSPAFPAGPYIKLDVGAGTTNVSLFRMVQAWSSNTGFQASKDRLCFFGAASVPLGMDSIDAALCRRFGDGRVAPVEFRGRETGYFETSAGLNACDGAINDIYMGVRKAAMVAQRHINAPAEKEAWLGPDWRPGQPPSRRHRAVRVVPRRHKAGAPRISVAVFGGALLLDAGTAGSSSVLHNGHVSVI